MTITQLYSAAALLNGEERETWTAAFLDTLEVRPQKPCRLEELIAELYIQLHRDELKTAVAYGAGRIAGDQIPLFSSYVQILEVWDTYSNAPELRGVPIARPHTDGIDANENIIIFVESAAAQYEIASNLRRMGFSNIYSFQDYLRVMQTAARAGDIQITDDTVGLLTRFTGEYAVLDDSRPGVNYEIVSKRLRSGQIKLTGGQDLADRLTKVLTVASDRAVKAVNNLTKKEIKDLFDFACCLELFLRELLADGVKTTERPLKMADDFPYDPFAVYEATKEILWSFCGKGERAVQTIQALRCMAPRSIPLAAVESRFLSEIGRLPEALELARAAVRWEVNSLLSSENFYQIALRCKEAGIHVEEPLPNYDLSEHYCWSGLTFALCEGFDRKDGTPLFRPCFRTLQCAAAPDSADWDSDGWVEFRRSILDGSFRYCQKTQCSNLLAGWLPKKAECVHPTVRKILEGDPIVPPLEELHFSYDTHCNLKCPSCRLEIQTNSAERSLELDMCYEQSLKPLLREAKHLCMSGCGEAIISPHSRKLLQSLNRREYPELSIELRTNVTSVTPVSWEGLGEGRTLIRHIAASIDAASKELFERLRSPAKWEAVQRNLAFIQKLRNTGEIELFEFHVVVQESNVDELMDIIRQAVQFDADAVTFSQLVNWRGMSEEEYQAINPFLPEHPKHGRLMQVIGEIAALRTEIEAGRCALTNGKKTLKLNMHAIPDPGPSYQNIRVGRLKIR